MMGPCRRAVPVLAVVLLTASALNSAAHSETPGSVIQQERSSGHPSVDEMAVIPGGSFEIGIDRADVPRLERLFHIDAVQLFEPEMPRHAVTIASFYLDKYPVTNAQFRKFTDSNPEWRPDR